MDVKTNVPDKEAPLSFTPENTPQSAYSAESLYTDDSSYRYRCPGPGVFQCSVTGLVFVMAQEAELLYTTVQWDDALLQPASKKTAGPLFEIKCSEDAAVCQLHLPHCETKDALVFNGLMSVVHITDDGMTILEPLEITDTHVVVKVPNLSVCGLVWNIYRRFRDISLPIKGRVMLFLRPPHTRDQILNVFLLQGNVHVDEVSKRHRRATYIELPPDCLVDFGQRYSVHCEPKGFHIQPEGEQFDPSYGPNYHPSFEVFVKPTTEKVTLWVQDKEKKVVWKSDVFLEGVRAKIQQKDDAAMGQKLLTAPAEFIVRVSYPVLNRLLEKLLEHGVITDAEMQTARAKERADKARDVMDMVAKKGSEACSVVVTALRELDPYLYSTLNLR